jgi:hypothetical protein
VDGDLVDVQGGSLRERTGEADIQYTTDQNRWNVGIQGTWDLDELIYNPVEPRVAREQVRLINMRDRVVDEVTRRFYERRRLQIDMELSPPTDLNDRVRKELRIQELTADMDALTGGWFSEKLTQIGRDPY